MKILKLFLSIIFLGAFLGCEESDSEKAWGIAQISMPQSTINDGGTTNNYPVPLINSPVQNYTLDSTSNSIDIRLGVYRSGLQELNSFTVDIISRSDTVSQLLSSGMISNAALLPPDVYSFPENITVPAGDREAAFIVKVDLQRLIENHMNLAGTRLLLAVGIANPTNYEISKSRSVTVIVIDSRHFMPAPPIQNYIQGGDMEAESQQFWMWTGGDQEWGYAEDGPVDGTGGSLRWFNETSSDVNGVIYQEVQLEAGAQYQLSAKIKIPSGAVSFWIDFNLTDILPGEPNWDATGDFMGIWTEEPLPLLDGDIRDVGNVGWGDYGNGLAAGSNGIFTASGSTMYVFIKLGVCCGGTFNGPVLIDEVKLTKVE